MKIGISEYDASWPQLFKWESDRLLQLIPLEDILVEHIGSTAVPGLAAKPVIDILIGVRDEAELDILVAALVVADYFYIKKFESEMPFRRLFIRAIENDGLSAIPKIIVDDSWKQIDHSHRISHIHCVAASHPFYAKHIRFRDILRRDVQVRLEYEALKWSLAKKEWNSGADYANAKTEFIAKILQ